MERLFRARIIDGSLQPFDPVTWKQALLHWPHSIVWVALQDEKRVRSGQQNRYWWGVVIPTVSSAWQHEMGWAVAPPKEVVHGALIKAVFGTVQTPLGPERRSSSSLTTEEFSELCEWVRDYCLTKYAIRIPEPNEVME